MCIAVTCRKCHRPTWKGCGAHVEQVLGHVPPDRRCDCAKGERAKGERAKGRRFPFFSR